MAMTPAVKNEISHLPVTRTCCRKAEVSAILRFAGGLHLVSGRIVIEAELDTGNAARRLKRDILEIFGHSSELIVMAPGGLRRGSRFVVRVVAGGDQLARQTGLVDGRGRPIRGLPPQVVSGATCDAEAAWRGAFLAHGSLTEPGRSSSLEVTCPGPEAALALVGAARRLSIAAKAREVRGVDRVVVRDGDAIGALLTRLGAHDAVLAWEERRMRREVRATANRLANFDDANLRRSARAAVAAGARVGRALEILGEEVPEHLAAAGRLRMEHKQASLEELGALADPPLTKDAVAGRIRRLLAMADKRAQDLGIPGTESTLSEETRRRPGRLTRRRAGDVGPAPAGTRVPAGETEVRAPTGEYGSPAVSGGVRWPSRCHPRGLGEVGSEAVGDIPIQLAGVENRRT
ncbi:putative cell division protein WhiA OS=Streptomyces sp. ACT-1 OX=1609288 GN=whiA PE=3 SV=1 [Streptomyces griseus subsp. griseus]